MIEMVMGAGINFGVDAGSLELLLATLPFLIPLAIIQLAFLVAALVSIFRHDSYKMGTRTVWIIIVILLNTIGPILYFVLGRKSE